MANFSTVIDLLIERIESYTPTRDPKVRFRRSEVNKVPSQAYRAFTVDNQINVTPTESIDHREVYSGIALNFYYKKKFEQFSQFKEVMSDMEELYKRIIFTPSSQWGASSNITANFDSMSSRETDELLIIDFNIDIYYTIT